MKNLIMQTASIEKLKLIKVNYENGSAISSRILAEYNLKRMEHRDDICNKRNEAGRYSCCTISSENSLHMIHEGIIPREIQDSFLDEAYSDEKMKYRLENTFVRCRRRGRSHWLCKFSPVRLQNEAELGAFICYQINKGKDRKCFITKRVNSIKRNGNYTFM